MSRNSKAREVWVGLVVITAMAALLALVTMASDGPGFLAPQRTIDVVFRDVQGLRVGSPVRVAGLDSGNVVAADIVEVDGMLWTQVRITLPAKLVQEAPPRREDLDSAVAHRHEPCQRALGREVGRGAGSRPDDRRGRDVVLRPDHRAVRAGPGRAEPLESHRRPGSGDDRFDRAPRASDLELAPGDSEQPARDERFGPTRGRVDSATRSMTSRRSSIPTHRGSKGSWPRSRRTADVKEMLAENRENVRLTMASVRDFVAATNDIIDKNRPKVERMVDGFEGTRARADRVLYQADQMETQLSLMLARNQAEIDRSITNVRDATDWLSKLVQKIFSNPFVLEPVLQAVARRPAGGCSLRHSASIHEGSRGGPRRGQDA